MKIACGLFTLILLSSPAKVAAESKYATATFAGGCFWCMQPVFEKLHGVMEVFAGYAGGKGENPNYDDYTEGDPAIHLYPSKSPLHLGAQIDPAGKVNYFGKIAMDDVAIYDRALSAVEIQAIYNAGSAGKSLPRNHAGVKRHASPPR